ncbi:MAG: oligosaccharide flippase family protein [Crocinitomicaceae bacterium]|nr:oligosaccharide flippase family protein [Crocinitomicaceae bacterium]MCF8411549.1 oligosaccharide flippase family protein [Crocinitomicaceae bacterium]MCF8444273.1 oligosaccharide flippase family protein [Crocinitomicaceae bacterium]
MKNSDFIKSLTVLLTGTLIAQFIGYALAPVISRQFSPTEMGEFGMFQRWVVLLATIATARYEFSLPLPKRDEHSFQLYRLALFSTMVTLGITLVGFLIYGLYIEKAVGFALWALVLVFSTAALVFFNLGTNWAIRHKEFKRISFSKMTNSLSLNISRVLSGFFHMGKWGLFLSFLLSLLIGAAHFLKDFFHWNKKPTTSLSKKKMMSLARTYKDFPLINLPHALSDNLREVLVALLIIEVFSEQIFGSFDHTFRMLRLPVMIIGTSISQILFNRISSYRLEKKMLMPIVVKVFLSLSVLSLIPFSIVYFYGQPLFVFVFGEQWQESGRLSEIMAPWLMLNFVSSPLTIIPLVLEQQKKFFFIGISASILQVLGFLVLPMLLNEYKDGMYMVFQIITWSQVAVGLITVMFIFSIIQKEDRKNAAY